ncbi:MAG: SRPBCC domain-containing protein [Pseudomonadota bacterium]
MITTLLKWGLPLVVIVVVAAAVLTRKTFHVETVIAAPPDIVWQILTETRAYPEWNPVFVEAAGAYAEGARLSYRVRDPKGKLLEMDATVVTFTPARELRQKGGVPGILTFEHQWILEPVEGGTKVIQHETDRGLGLWFWNSDWIEPAYAKTLEALKARAEGTAAGK